MSVFSDPRTLSNARVHMWVDQILKNLDLISQDLSQKKYLEVRKALVEQYRLIFVLRDAKQGKTILQGWKTESPETGE